MRQRWSDDVPTDLLPVGEPEHVDHERRPYLPMWMMKLLFIVVTVAAVAASVIVALQISNRSAETAGTADVLPGDCLTWPPGQPERAMHVECVDEHLFEVADSQAMQNVAADAERQQICARAVERYLGSRYDPGGRFVVGAVSTPGRLICGLQLPSNGIASVAFRVRVADQDQSRVWPTGTCLGIREGDTTDVAVDCGLPHALEITGTVDLSTVFGRAAPSTTAQDAVVRDACGAATAEYLSPGTLDASLALRYQPIDATGWGAGSRRIACRIGSPKSDGGWATLVRSAKDGVVIEGQPAVTPPAPVEPAPAPAPPEAEPVPAEVAAPTSETSEPSPPAEVPVRVDRQTDESTSVADPVPHIDGSEGPGPVPHMAGSEVPGPVPHMAGPEVPGPVPHLADAQAPGPAPQSPSTEPLPDSESPPLG